MSAGAGAPPLLELVQFSLRYPGATDWALNQISVGLHSGHCLGIVGESGSGKSSLALALIGLHARTVEQTGTLRLAGRGLAFDDEPAWRGLRGRTIGYIFQDAATSLHPLRSVQAQLREMLVEDSAMSPALAEVGLPSDPGFLRRHPHQLSGGQRQRLMIALALAAGPKLLICDEPTSALDTLASSGVLALLRRLKQERGLALVLVSHDLAAVAALADDLLVLRRGRVEAQGATASVLASEQAYVRLLLASRPGLGGNPARLGATAVSTPARPAAGAVLVDVQGLAARHADRTALAGVALSLRAGETLGIIGVSGSGKSTLARTLLSLHAADAERMQIAGADPRRLRGSALRQWRRRVQVVFQDPGSALDPRQRVRDCIGEALDLHALVADRAAREARILELLHAVQLDAALIDRYPHQLSGGQQQRVAIARALATSPELLICDEAISALDVSVQAGVLNLLADLRDQRGLGLIFIGHDLAAMSFIADQLIVLDRGRIVEAGRTADVLAAPRHELTRALLVAVPERFA
jgi:peptide/nickel transport system ATP-binding protein